MRRGSLKNILPWLIRSGIESSSDFESATSSVVAGFSLSCIDAVVSVMSVDEVETIVFVMPR
jgi:hypothetical protein